MNVTDLNPLKRPSVPHILMPSHGSPGPSQQFQISPQTQDPNIVWVQSKGAQINSIRDAPFPQPSFIRLSKVPENEHPPPL